ncbi:cyclin-like protein [Chaetomium fimeti]|uniref:Cyclin-like protein n=1 Tax=Chaetomium fimeti TaxID=1854472 RepID=A0AAE0HM80_9PEZI|nr:cyclin-like protein [Chaetomium fimeti]
MDAKPQRPLRAVVGVSGNENTVPSKQPFHHQNKSVGNHKPMAATGALNAPPKRTAFGDVSNTARSRVGDPIGKPASKETIKTRAKAVTKAPGTRNSRLGDKENAKDGVKESRARTTIASKGTSHNSKFQASAHVPAANPGPRVSAPVQQHTGTSLAQPPLRNGASKKIVSIFQDPLEKASIRPELASLVDDLAVPVEKPVKNPRNCKSQPSLRTEPQSLRAQQTRFLTQSDNVAEVEEEGDIDDNVTEAAYEDAVEQLPQRAEHALRDALADMEQANYSTLYRDEPEVAVQPKALPDLPASAELEEYWDDEEEPELYDEQGYTTAHSYRSHGDNTISGTTTLLAPHATAGDEEELDMAKVYVVDHQTEEEIEEEAWDVSMVTEYGDDIFTYMRELEARMVPNAHYMDDQTEIQWSMRSVLMDWLVQVHHRFCLLPETLFLTVNYIDRFLSVKVVSLGKLQLVGATALFVAAKYEEINCPSVQEIVYMVDSGYSVDEILKAERFMLSMLHFELGWPGPMSFLRRISKADDYDLETRTLAKYFLEITIMDERFVSSPPSFLAAGAHCISRLFLGKGDWTLAHVHYSGYTLCQLRPLIKMLFECCQYPRKHHGAVYDKYSTPKYKQSSTFVEGKIANGLTLSQLYAGCVHGDTSGTGSGMPSQYKVPSNPIRVQG